MARHSRTARATPPDPMEIFTLENTAKALARQAIAGAPAERKQAALALKVIAPRFRAMMKRCGAGLAPDHRRDLEAIDRTLASLFRTRRPV